MKSIILGALGAVASSLKVEQKHDNIFQTCIYDRDTRNTEEEVLNCWL